MQAPPGMAYGGVMNYAGGSFVPRQSNYEIGPIQGGQTDARYELWKKQVPFFAQAQDYVPGGSSGIQSAPKFAAMPPPTNQRADAGSNNGTPMNGFNYGQNPQLNDNQGFLQMLSNMPPDIPPTTNQAVGQSAAAVSANNGLIQPPAGLDMSGPKYNLPANYDLNLPSYNDAVAANDQYPDWTKMNLASETPVNTAEQTAQATDNAAQLAGTDKKFTQSQVSPLNAGLSMASNLIGDIAEMRNLRKAPKQVILPDAVPARVDYERERQAARRFGNQSQNLAARLGRDTGSPGAQANQLAGLTALQDSLGTALGQSYDKEFNTNAQYQQQANMANAQSRGQQNVYNASLQRQGIADQNKLIENMSEILPKGIADYNAQVKDNSTMNMTGKDYGRYMDYNPNETFVQRMKRLMQMNDYQTVNRRNPQIETNPQYKRRG